MKKTMHCPHSDPICADCQKVLNEIGSPNPDKQTDMVQDLAEWIMHADYNQRELRIEIRTLLAAYSAAVASRVIGENKETLHVRVRENTHGPCCQCQICGEDYDDCILNHMLDEDELRNEQRQALAALDKELGIAQNPKTEKE